MNNFWLWFTTGIEHILDLGGYDHILFVSLLVLTYCFNEWKKLIWLITAFTVGHSASLALSVSGKISIETDVVEFLIGFSILVTAVYHIINLKNAESKHEKFLFFIVVFFGLIHGLGFSYILKAMLSSQDSIVLPLLYFNIGLEVGQLIIVLMMIVLSLIVAFLFKVPYKLYKLILVAGIGLVALKITIERLLILFGHH